MNDVVRTSEESGAGASHVDTVVINSAREKTVEAAKAAAPMPGVPADPAKAKEAEEKQKREDREKRLVAARARFRASKSKPAWFVVWTLGAWWVLSVLADMVITCVPGGAACRAPQLVDSGRRILASITGRPFQIPPGPQTPPMTRYDWALLLLALVAALWVAKAKVYPDADDAGEFTDDELEGKAERDGAAAPSGMKV